MSVEVILAVHGACPQTRFVSAGDREADVSACWQCHGLAGVDLLIRAAWDRCVTHAESYVWTTGGICMKRAKLQLNGQEIEQALRGVQRYPCAQTSWLPTPGTPLSGEDAGHPLAGPCVLGTLE